MFWLTLWLAWLSKLLSFMEGALQQRDAPPKFREVAPVEDESAPEEQEIVPEREITPAQREITPLQAQSAQRPAAPPQEPAAPAVAATPREVAPKQRLQPPAPLPEAAPPRQVVAPASQSIAAIQQERVAPPQTEALPQRGGASERDSVAPAPVMAPGLKDIPPPPLEEIARKLREIAQGQESTPPAPRPSSEIAPKRQEGAPPPPEITSKILAKALPAQAIAPGQQVASIRHISGKEEHSEGSMTWRKRPMIYEIPTWVWVDELRAKHGAGLTLGTIPAAEWDALAELAIDAVWLMGVWERSPAGVAVSNANAGQQDEFRRLLPDYTLADNVGSAYCVRDYVVAEHLGGPAALAAARAELNARGLRLILDFVPNHVAIDHPWAAQHPDYFVRGTAEDLVRAPTEFVEVQGQVLANGRDPNYEPWRDVLQLNAYHPQLRAAAIATVTAIAAQCDGMRCDMAMLLLNDTFRGTWGDRAGEKPATEYWQEVIPAVKAEYPNTLFIAEVYWDLEYEMMQKGFDYCYDKRLYDRLVKENAESVRAHLTAGLDYQDRLVRFIENHDEPRAAATFHGARERAAAIVVATTPGARLIYDGQIEGRQVNLPVFLARRRPEAPKEDLVLFYRALLGAVHTDLFHEGEWHLCECSGWPDNSSFHDIVAWTWRYRDHRTLIVVNLSAHPSQAMVHLSWDDLRGQTWRLVETLTWECYPRDGDDLSDSGLFVNLDAWGYHFLKFE